MGEGLKRARAAAKATRKKLSPLAAQHSADIGHLTFLRRAILAGDPLNELLLRIDDLIAAKRRLLETAGVR